MGCAPLRRAPTLRPRSIRSRAHANIACHYLADGKAAAGVLAAAILASSNAAMAQGADAGSDSPLVSQLGSTLSDAAKRYEAAVAKAPSVPKGTRRDFPAPSLPFGLFGRGDAPALQQATQGTPAPAGPSATAPPADAEAEGPDPPREQPAPAAPSTPSLPLAGKGAGPQSPPAPKRAEHEEWMPASPGSGLMAFDQGPQQGGGAQAVDQQPRPSGVLEVGADGGLAGRGSQGSGDAGASGAGAAPAARSPAAREEDASPAGNSFFSFGGGRSQPAPKAPLVPARPALTEVPAATAKLQGMDTTAGPASQAQKQSAKRRGILPLWLAEIGVLAAFGGVFVLSARYGEAVKEKLLEVLNR
ncbi:hypothetical protein ACKKBG_A02555 [Auxenochlorella protothecoides x Auxenochlorella symbiontica]